MWNHRVDCASGFMSLALGSIKPRAILVEDTNSSTVEKYEPRRR